MLFATPLKHAALFAILGCGFIASPTSATDKCNLVFFPGTKSEWSSVPLKSFIFNTETCALQKVETPHIDCEIGLGHLSAGNVLQCGESIKGNWLVQSANASDFESLLEPHGLDRVQKHSIKLGPKQKIADTVMETYLQDVRYSTARGEKRMGVVGSTKLGCTKMWFHINVQHQNSQKLSSQPEIKQVFASTKQDMTQFLQNLRLTTVEDLTAELCPDRNISKQAADKIATCQANPGTMKE